MDRICPLLAMASDRRTVCDGYDPNHRCWSPNPPPALDRTQQLDVCLSAAHASCPYFGNPVTGHDQGIPLDQRITSSRLVIEPEGAWHGLASRSVTAARGRRVLAASVTLVAAGALATASGGLAAVSGFAADLQQASTFDAAADRVVPLMTMAPSSTPTGEPTSTPQPVALPSVVLTPAPTASPVAAPSLTVVTPTPAAPPSPPSVRRYVVQPGDTLSRIADRFGVSVRALQQANGIADQNVISVGQSLIIPASG